MRPKTLGLPGETQRRHVSSPDMEDDAPRRVSKFHEDRL
jgi:hypothetical protein